MCRTREENAIDLAYEAAHQVEFVDLDVTQDPYWNFETMARIYWPSFGYQDHKNLWLETYQKLCGAQVLVKGIREWDEVAADLVLLMDICLDRRAEARYD